MKYPKAFLSLLNDYRDTIFYTVLVAVMIGNFWYGWGISVFVLISKIWWREIIRAFSWMVPTKQIAGESPKNIQSLISSAWFVTFSTLFPKYFHDVVIVGYTVFPYVGAVVLLCFTSLECFKAGGINKIITNYIDIMFDFPRKNRPPGQRNLLLSKLDAFVSSFSGGFSKPVLQRIRN